MSAHDASHDHAGHDDHAHDDGHSHGTRRGYLIGFALSAVLTALPSGWS